MLAAPGSGAVRIARGLVCASTGLLLGDAAHVLGAGHPPSPLAITVSFALLALVGVALAESRRGFGFIAAVLGGGQIFLHLTFSCATAPAIVVTGPGHAVLVAPGGAHRMPAAAPVEALTGGAAASWSPAMTLAHIVATLTAAALMAYGERAVWRLAGLVLPSLWVFRRPVPPLAAVPRPGPEPVAVVRRYGALLARSRPRRGPPGFAAP